MPIEQAIRAIAIDDISVTVSVWRWICDGCGFRQTFHDIPLPEGISELAPQNRGWRIDWSTDDGEACKCPTCSSRPRPSTEGSA